MEPSQELFVFMLCRFGTVVASLVAPKVGATTVALRSYIVPESTVLFLVGGGLMVLASLVRRLYPLREVVAPKSIEMVLWVSPQQEVEGLAQGERVEFSETPDPDYSARVM